jgi:hypothetical protein
MLSCLLLGTGCAHFKLSKKASPAAPTAKEAASQPPPPTDPSVASPPKESVPPENPNGLHASGQSTGLKLFGLLPVWNASPEKARASLYAAIGKDLSDSTVTLQKQSISRSESQYLLFSIPRVSLSADVVRSVPYQPPSGDPADIPGAPLRRGVPVSSPHP